MFLYAYIKGRVLNVRPTNLGNGIGDTSLNPGETVSASYPWERNESV